MTISAQNQTLNLANRPGKNPNHPPSPSAHALPQDSFLPSDRPLEFKSIPSFFRNLQSQASEAKDLGTISHRQFQFDQGTEVVSSAQKFIIPVPTFQNSGGGEELVYPQGATDGEGRNLAGQAIKDWQGNPIAKPGEKGVVFYNAKDRSYQAVKADGEGVVILNQVSEEQAKKLQDKLGKDPSEISLGKFKEALTWAHEELGLGDQYNSDRGFIASKMNPMENSHTGVVHYGLHRRDDRDVCRAVYVEGSGEFQGPAATAQKFDKGAILLRQPDSKAEDGFAYRLIQPDAFQQTYTEKDGSAIVLGKMARQTPMAL